jgi:8-oxo-dGTP pyrophosphatase MutT (NUDIX family)
MACVGPGNYVVVVLHVGGCKASDTKLVLKREPRTCKTWFLAGSILPNEEHVVAVRELLEETCLTLTPDNLTLLSNNQVPLSLLEGRHHHVYVFSAYVPLPFVATILRTHAKVEQAAIVQSTINPDGTYVVLESTYIDGFSLTPTMNGLLPSITRKFELLNFMYVAQ